MSHLVAVYGTLKRGFHNHYLLETSVFKGLARAPGKLYVRGLPFFKRVSDVPMGVYCELYSVDDETLARLDRLEGYREHNPETSLYNRVEVEVEHFLNHEEEEWIPAYIYEYNGHVEETYRKEDGVYNG